MLGPAEIAVVRQFAGSIGVVVAPDAEQVLLAHAGAMLEWIDRANLSAIRQPRDVAIKHIADSLACLLAVDRAAWPRSRVIDIGTGAGYPGLPLRIVEPPDELVLLEATIRKAQFLSHFLGSAGLDRVTVIADRAERLARLPDHRESYDVAVARAVAELAVLVEMALPLLKVGGVLIAPKSAGLADELRLATGALRELAGEVERTIEYRLPEVDEVRTLVVVRKLARSSDRYPRRDGIPAKRPLR